MKQRVISAIIAIIIVFPLIYLGGIYFKVLGLLIGLFALYEMMKARGNIPNPIKYISYMLFILFFINNFKLIDVGLYMDLKFLILMLFTLVFPIVMYQDKKKYNIDDSFFLIGSILFLSISFNVILEVRDVGLLTFIYLILITILTDTFAYIMGTKFGKHKLVPSISPKKSIEGLIFGTVIGTVVASAFYLIFISSNNYYIILFTLLLSLVGQIGDLIFSAIKRNYDIKDFSNIMPGHGGILDRLDSIIFVSLAYVYILELL